MSLFYKNAGYRIRELREMNRYTREQFAEAADISPKFLYEIETGQKGFSADTLHRIAKALSVGCDYILSGKKQDMYGEEVLDTIGMFSCDQMVAISKILELLYEVSCKKDVV